MTTHYPANTKYALKYSDRTHIKKFLRKNVYSRRKCNFSISQFLWCLAAFGTLLRSVHKSSNIQFTTINQLATDCAWAVFYSEYNLFGKIVRKSFKKYQNLQKKINFEKFSINLKMVLWTVFSGLFLVFELQIRWPITLWLVFWTRNAFSLFAGYAKSVGLVDQIQKCRSSSSSSISSSNSSSSSGSSRSWSSHVFHCPATTTTTTAACLDLAKYDLDIFGIQETRRTGDWPWNAQLFLTNSLRSSNRSKQAGVAIVVKKTLLGCIIENVTVNERLCYIKFAVQQRTNLIVIVCYAPTNEADIKKGRFLEHTNKFDKRLQRKGAQMSHQSLQCRAV